MSVLEIDDLKAHLNISDDVDDQLIAARIEAAEAFVDRWIATPLAELDPVPPDLKQAVRLLVGHWYENREATLVGVGAEQVPLGFWDLITPHRVWSF
jgi:uncharacterized phage protein (predicted DNA packaging)